MAKLLYYRLASSTATEFYEVNLVDLLTKNDPESFKYFYLFFRKAAYERTKLNESFLERVRDEFMTYARVVGDKLKALVYEEVFPYIAGGFVAYRHQKGLNNTTDDARKELQEAALSLLYKLLFLFMQKHAGSCQLMMPVT